MAVNPDGTRAYVTNFVGDKVSVIDTDQASTNYNKVIANIAVGVAPNGVAVSPDGNRAYVTNIGSNTVSVINTETNSVTATIGRGYRPPDIAIPNYSAVSSLATPYGPGFDINFSDPYGVALNADGTRAFVTNNGSSELLVIDTATYALIATVRVRSTPEGVAVNPGGTKVYVANNGNSSVSVIDI